MLHPHGIALLLAVLAVSAIPLVLYAWLGFLRVPMVAHGQIATADIALSGEAWPKKVRQVSNALDNQFQLPILFYLTAGVMLFWGPSLWEVVFAWIFAVSRIVHVSIHVTDNHIVRRFLAFAVGFGVLVLLWLSMTVRTLTLVF